LINQFHQFQLFIIIAHSDSFYWLEAACSTNGKKHRTIRKPMQFLSSEFSSDSIRAQAKSI
jgi:hypothetical protein